MVRTAANAASSPEQSKVSVLGPSWPEGAWPPRPPPLPEVTNGCCDLPKAEPRALALPRGRSMKLTRLADDAGVRAPPYLARQVSRVETRTPGVTDVQLPDLFGSGAGETPALSLLDMGVGRWMKGWMNNTGTQDFTQVQAIAR